MDLDENEDKMVCLEIPGDENETLKELNTQRLSGLLCDVNLIVDGEVFPAHKGVLAAHSSFFLTMFTTDMLEKDKASVSLRIMSAGTMKSLLEFMYIGQIQIHVDNVLELLEASSFLFVEKVKKACCQFLESIVKKENCFEILSIAHGFSCNGLIQTVNQYVNQKFTELAKTESFLRLPKEDIIKFLSSEDIQIDNEEQLLELLIDWVNHDLKQRKHCFTQMLKLIRLPHIQEISDQNELTEFRMASKIRQPGKEVIWTQKAGNFTSRKSCSAVDVIVVAGGCDNSAILNSVCCYIPAVDKWTDLSQMQLPRWRAGHCVVLLENRVYAIGGFQAPRQHVIPDMIRSVETYDIAKDVWTCVQHMNVGRQFAAAVSLNDSIFVFGGSDGHNVLRSCEVYNPKLNRWQHISPMQYSRMKHCAVVHAGKVYVVGGVSSNRPGHVLSSVECYIPEENRWTSVCDIPSRRFDHQCYVVKVGHKFISPVMEKPK